MGCNIATILIVDDTPANRDLLAAILNADGHRTLEASDGLEGLSVARDDVPDLIVADILMPTMNGFEFASRLRQQSAAASPPIVFCSATFHDTEMQTLARACGVSRLLSKPIQSEQVLRLVHDALASPDPAGPPISPAEAGVEVVQILNKKLFEKNGELLELNTQLERRIAGRTRDLMEANHLLRQEIDKREKTEKRLRQFERLDAVGKIAAGLAHNFNNLLAVIRGQSESLLAHAEDWESVRKLESINDAVKHGMNLTFQLLAFAGHQPVATEAVNFNKVLSSLEKLLQVTIGESVELDIHLDSELGNIEANSSQLEQVFVNLALHAKDAMPHGGKLTIRTSNLQVKSDDQEASKFSHPGSYVCVSISDTGRGMDEERQHRIFDPNFNNEDFESGTSTALGLSTVYGIVKRGGGQILVYSEPGRGSTFNIYWPYRAPSEMPAKLMERKAPSESSRTILVVENEVLLLEVTCEFLEESGYVVLSARSSEGALELARQHKGAIDLLLTDVVMPRMDGRELSRQLLKKRPQMKVLLVSGYMDDVSDGHESSAEMHAFLQKPFSRQVLKDKIRELIGSRSIPSV
ncbi:MAG TPA: response regulator [Terracidiphilus sp.]